MANNRFKKKPKPKSQAIFDEEYGMQTPVVDGRMTGGDTEEKPHEKDKIFFNDYNTGNVELQDFPEVRVQVDYASNYLGDVTNMTEYMDKKALLEAVYELFKQSQWKSLSLNKKFPKELMPFIFNDLYNGLAAIGGHTTINIVITITEFMDISYERAYEIAGLRVKEEIIREFEQAGLGRLSKRKINRLF